MLNAIDFSSIQAAVNALPLEGGTVFIAHGIWTDTAFPRFSEPGSSTLTLPTDRPVHLVGDGADTTIIRASSQTAHTIVVQGNNSSIERLTVENTALPPGSGIPSRGIVVGRTNSVLARFTISDCIIRNTPGYGLYVRGSEGGESTICIFGHYSRVRIVGNKKEGGIWLGPATTTQYFVDSVVEAFTGAALKASQSEGLSLVGCTFEDSIDHASPYVVLDRANVVVIDRSWFESHGVADTQFFIQVLGVQRNLEIRTSRFLRNDAVSVGRMLTVDGTSKSLVVVCPEIALGVAPTSTDDIKILNSATELCLIGGILAQPLSYHPIRVSGAAPVSSWMNGNGRVRVPQSAGTGGLTDVGNGDVLYDSTANKLSVHVGGSWRTVNTTP